MDLVDHAPEQLDPATLAEAARQLGEVLAAVNRRELAATRGQRDRLRGATSALSALVGPAPAT